MTRISTLALLILCVSVKAFSQNLQLDSAFGTNGFAHYYYQGHYDEVFDIALQDDGKIILIGDATFNTATLMWEVQRFNADGSVDSSFVPETGFLNGTHSNATAVAVQHDGRILVAGHTSLKQIIVRYELNGEIDSTFGTFGEVNIGMNAVRVFVLNDDKIVVVGSNGELTRLNYSGSTDPVYGIGGSHVITNINVLSATMQNDEKIIMSGFLTGGISGTEDAEFARVDTSGFLENSFGNGGRVYPLSANFNERVLNSLVQSDGKIITCSHWGVDTVNVLNRFDSNGNIDSSYIYYDTAAVEYSDGLILQNGKSVWPVFSYQRGGIGFVQLNVDGTKDSTFANYNVVASCIGIVYRTKMQSDGKILTAGALAVSGNELFSMFRFMGDLSTAINNPVDNSSIVPFGITQLNHSLIIDFFVNDINVERINLYDISGRKLYECNAQMFRDNQDLFVIPLSERFISGIYFISIETRNEGVLTEKFFVH